MRNCFSKIKDYVKENKLYVIVMILGFIAFCIQARFVVLYADDMCLGAEAKKGGLLYALKYLSTNYMTWGGGPTPFIAILFLKMGINVWKIFNSIMILVMVILSVKLVTYDSKINKAFIATLIWSFIYVLNIWISRETLYWLDGNLAYVLTTFQLLIYFYYLHSRFIRNTNIKKYDYILLPIVAFFSGWTGPQAAVLTVIIGILLILLKKFVRKEKVSILMLVTIAFGIIGCLVEVLAPGNNSRMQAFPEFSQYNFFEKIMYRIDSVYSYIFDRFELGTLSFYSFIAFGLISAIAYKVSDKEANKKIKYLVKSASIIIILFIFGILLMRYNFISDIFVKFVSCHNILEAYNAGQVNIELIIPYVITSFVMIITLLLMLYIAINRKDTIIFITYISALLSQGSMVLAPYQPDRAVFTSVILLLITISSLIKIAYEDEFDVNYIVILVFFIVGRNFGIIASIVYFIVSNLMVKDIKKDFVAFVVVCVLLAMQNWTIVTINYAKNEKIYCENVRRIENYINTKSKETEIPLLDLHDGMYSFGGFVGIDWVESAVKLYYEIDNSIKLVVDNNND